MVKIIILISVLAVISFYAARARRSETADITWPTISTSSMHRAVKPEGLPAHYMRDGDFKRPRDGSRGMVPTD